MKIACLLLILVALLFPGPFPDYYICDAYVIDFDYALAECYNPVFGQGEKCEFISIEIYETYMHIKPDAENWFEYKVKWVDCTAPHYRVFLPIVGG